MHYRCPYCHAELGEKKQPICPACGKHMRVTVKRTPDEQRKRHRTFMRIDRDAQAKLAQIRTTPNPQALYSPRVLFGILILLACIGTLLIGMANRHAATPDPEIPQRRALRELNVIATALGRYHFHVGHWPAPQPHGLLRLSINYRDPGWIGPYISHLRDDPWQSPYHYAVAADGTVNLFSLGPDRIVGTADDLRPDPAAFEVGTDWTNDWVRAEDRLPGVRILKPTAP